MRTAIFLVLLVNIKVTTLHLIITEVVKEINKHLVKDDAAVKADDFAGNLTELVTYGVTSIPLSGARLLGSSGDLSSCILGNNIDSTVLDKFMIDYKSNAKNEDATLTGTELASKYGYYVADHYVITDDGYILKVLRIQLSDKDADGKENCTLKRKPVVFFMHGLTGSADDFIDQGPKLSPAYILADLGYDVWLGNARGNRYSRNHTYLSPSKAKFWEFSFHEIGTKDLPSMIDYILQKTNEKKVGYIGHSQGTTSFFVMCSMLPEYNDKIAIMFALSAVAYVEHVVSPFVRILSLLTDQIKLTATLIGVNEFAPHISLINSLASQLCEDSSAFQAICLNSLFLICGFNLENVDTKAVSVAMGHLPAGASARAFAHYAQEVVSKKFCRYNFGSEGNLQRYGNKTAPDYPIDKITAPIFIFSSENDWLSSNKDVTRFAAQLCNLVELRMIPKFNHLDYILGIHTKEKVFDVIVKSLNDYLH